MSFANINITFIFNLRAVETMHSFLEILALYKINLYDHQIVRR